MEQKTNEIWKPIAGFPRYQISNQGRVKSFTSPKYPEGKILKANVVSGGYITLQLQSGDSRSGENKSYTKYVHRLMAEAFIEVPEHLKEEKVLQVDHCLPLKSGGKCELSNLRWVTPKGNCSNVYTRMNYLTSLRDREKRVYQYTPDLELVATYDSTADAGRRLRKSQGTIASCCSGALKRYLGFIFSYEPLTDLKQREEIEAQMEYQRRRNNESTKKAVMKYIKKKSQEGKAWYQLHREYARQKSHEYYERNKDVIKAKAKAKYDAKRKTAKPEELPT